MQNYAVVTIEQLDSEGHVWRRFDSHMVRASVPVSLDAITHGYDMERTRISVDGRVVAEPAADQRLLATVTR